MASSPDAAPRQSNAYELFILVLTILSLGIMVCLILPLSEQTKALLTVYDNLCCVIFLIDFAMNMIRSHPKRDYFIGRRGWLDLIGSIPSFGLVFPGTYNGLLRLARLSRLARVSVHLRGDARQRLVNDLVKNRGQYAVFITVMSAFTVLVVASVIVLQVESAAPDGNITTGGDAFWWGIVTITTVGYGDFFPVTAVGRITGVFVMFAGVGIIGSLASILASLLVPTAAENQAAAEEARVAGAAGAPEAASVAVPETLPETTLRQELIDIKEELVALRRALSAGGGESLDMTTDPRKD